MRFLQNWSLVMALMLPDILSATSKAQQPTKGLQEYTMTLRSPNVHLLNNNAFTCTSADVPSHMESSSIWRIRPQPMPGVHHHILMHVCDEPGSRGPGGESWSWDCSLDSYFAQRTPDLTPGHQCLRDGRLAGGVNYQFQGGSPDEGTLTFPPGTGIPVAAHDGRRKTLVAMFHYPNNTSDGMTGVSSLEVTLIRSQTNVRTAGSLLLGAVGYVGPQSVGSISGSWKLQQMPIHVLRLFSHWHDKAVDVQVGVKKRNGDEYPLLHQDPHKFSGITNITDSSSSVMSPGDRLTFQCTYNNTMSTALRVELREMCYFIMHYSVDGNEALADTDIISYDPRTSHCFPFSLDAVVGLAFNFEASSTFHGPVTDAECRSLDK